MSLYFITGASGSGKSTLALELRNRGYEAYDTDDDGLARWQHNKTGYIHPKSTIKIFHRTPEFLANHDWNVPREYVETITQKNQEGPVFLLGSIGNEYALQDLFAGGFWLKLGDEEITRRLLSRKNNDWGKQPHELELTIEAYKKSEVRWLSFGYKEIDATQTVSHVADKIIAAVLQDQR